jgi:hypothetical protein
MHWNWNIKVVNIVTREVIHESSQYSLDACNFFRRRFLEITNDNVNSKDKVYSVFCYSFIFSRVSD